MKQSLLAIPCAALLASCATAPMPEACNMPLQNAARERMEKLPAPDNYVRAQLFSDRLGAKKLDCLSQNGDVLFEGDIVIGRVAAGHPKGIAITGVSYRWKSSVIPYVFDPSFPNPGRVQTAMSKLQATGIVSFVQHTIEPDYLVFVAGGNPNIGSSPVGRQGKGQEISLGANCGYGVAMHEICHSLGLWHEQSRSDRDQFICILWDNINPKMRYNFDQHVHDGTNLGKYDYDSIMHYFSTAFSKNGQPTIVSRQAGVTFGQQDHLSSGDVNALRAIMAN